MKKNKKIGIITFHNSNNCGSMLESFAMNRIVDSIGFNSEIINYSSEGQQQLYKSLFPWNSPKNIIKNLCQGALFCNLFSLGTLFLSSSPKSSPAN